LVSSSFNLFHTQFFLEPKMPNQDNRKNGAPPHSIYIEKKKTNWIAWLALTAGLLALLFALSRNNEEPDGAVGNTTSLTMTVDDQIAPTEAVPQTGAIGDYLGGREALPRTFVFGTLNFAAAKSDIRAADRAEIAQVVATLKQYPNSRVRVVGYADARGNDPANAALGKARADSVKATIVAGGVAATRIETATGGETDPVASNQTGSGQAANRRTELVVLER
jgi:outer membrane protein OmpA-like peptidoglycan-associated protein